MDDTCYMLFGLRVCQYFTLLHLYVLICSIRLRRTRQAMLFYSHAKTGHRVVFSFFFFFLFRRGNYYNIFYRYELLLFKRNRAYTYFQIFQKNRWGIDGKWTTVGVLFLVSSSPSSSSSLPDYHHNIIYLVTLNACLRTLQRTPPGRRTHFSIETAAAAACGPSWTCFITDVSVRFASYVIGKLCRTARRRHRAKYSI